MGDSSLAAESLFFVSSSTSLSTVELLEVSLLVVGYPLIKRPKSSAGKAKSSFFSGKGRHSESSRASRSYMQRSLAQM